MPTVSQINETIQFGESFKLLSESLSEIASLKLKKIKKDTQRNIAFYNEISELYHTLKVQASRRKITMQRKNNKTVSILLTSNYRFYGDLNYSLARYFALNSSRYASDSLVVGSTGASFLKSLGTKVGFDQYIFKKDEPDDEDLKTFMGKILPYSRVIVYYAKFKTVLNQIPSFKDITASSLPEEVVKMQAGYIFEPELGAMLTFFGDQITTLLFEGVLLETELARLAARLISTTQAQDNAEEFVKKERRKLSVAQRSFTNRGILEAYGALLSLKGFER